MCVFEREKVYVNDRDKLVECKVNVIDSWGLNKRVRGRGEVVER